MISERSFKHNMNRRVRELRVESGRQEMNEKAGLNVQPTVTDKVTAVGIVDQSSQRILTNMNTDTRMRSNPLRLRPYRRGIPGSPVHGCRDTANCSDLLKRRLTTRLAFESGQNLPDHVVKRAATDAEALAWSTPYPLLFLPALMEEKVEGARLWLSRQREILERQKALALAV